MERLRNRICGNNESGGWSVSLTEETKEGKEGSFRNLENDEGITPFVANLGLRPSWDLGEDKDGIWDYLMEKYK